MSRDFHLDKNHKNDNDNNKSFNHHDKNNYSQSYEKNQNNNDDDGHDDYDAFGGDGDDSTVSSIELVRKSSNNNHEESTNISTIFHSPNSNVTISKSKKSLKKRLATTSTYVSFCRIPELGTNPLFCTMVQNVHTILVSHSHHPSNFQK